MSRLRHLRINPCLLISFFSPNVFWCSWEAVAAQFWCGQWPGPSWALDDQHLHPCESVGLSYQCGRHQGPTLFQTPSFMDVDGWNIGKQGDWWPVGSMSHIEPFLVSGKHCSSQVFRCCQALVAALKSNETVVDINLASNYLGDKGAEACIVGTLWHLENMGTDLKWAQSEATLQAWRLFLLMHCKSKPGWFDFDWTLMTLETWFLMHFDAHWYILIMFVLLLQVIAAFLNENSTIRFLNLETCLIKDAGVEARCVLHLSERNGKAWGGR